MIASFEIEAQEFTALNGGPEYHFTPAISFYVSCETQDEVDYYWEKLSKGGKEVQCGWLTDKFGVSWQIVPVGLTRLMSDPDPEKVQRVTQALYQMVKIDLGKLEQVYAQG